MKHLLLAMFCSFLAAQAADQPPRKLTAEEAISFPSVTGMAVSPNEAIIAYSTASVNWQTGTSTTEWHSKLQLPFPLKDAGNLTWSADGQKAAFFTKEKDKTYLHAGPVSQIHRICEINTPNAYLAAAGNRIAWSPDGERIAFTGTQDSAPPANDPLVITRIQYKTRTSISDNRRLRIFLVRASPSSTPQPLTPAGSDAHSISWGSANEIVYLSNPERDPDAVHNYDIFAVNIFSGATRQITRTAGVEMTPTVSPDGNWIAYTATTRPITTIDSVAEDNHVWVIPYAGGAARELNKPLDRRCSRLRWTKDSKAVLYLAADRGRMLPYITEIAGLATRPLLNKDAAVAAFEITLDGSLYFLMSSPVTPSSFYRLSPGKTEPEMISPPPPSFTLVQPDTWTISSFDATKVEAWFYPPLPNSSTSAKSPLILTIHGGPHGMHSYAFNTSAQYYTARGYAVLAVNPRGSSGYGQQFADGCINNWGGGDYKDLMAALDFALKKYPQIDATRLGVTGSSYGGFMTNWVITQTGRFRAAVSVASLSNLVSFYSTSLYQDLVHAEFNGFPWDRDNFQTLWKWSPLAHVVKAKTPTLFLHGERDNDVHITQAEEMFTALRYRGIASTLVRYPREGHGITEPLHRLDALQRTLDWMDRHLSGTAQ
ncbi:MAG: S9 family peptidase [Acidobacteriia bacterium]|nr:S9 family peptidase [Terriglobia bacterium]